MSASVARMGHILGLGSRMSWLLAVAGVVGVAGVAALATRQGMLQLLVTAVAAGLVTLVSFRWPLLTLGLFAALIPIEEVVLIDGLGTLSRFAGILFAVTYGVPRLGRLSFAAMPPAAWAYLAWAIVSLGWALDPATGWGQIQTLLQLFFIALFVADFVIQRPGIVRPVMWTYSVSATATALIGLESYVLQGLADSRASAIQDQNPAQFAAVLLPALVFGLYEALNGRRRIAGAAIAFITTLGVVVSGTRGAWVAVVVVVLLVILPQLSVRRRVALVGMTLAITALALQVPGVSELIADRTGSALSTGGAGRTDIWSVGLTIYSSSPVLGVGYANFPVANTADIARATAVGAWLTGYGPHNLVVGTLVELGPIGLVLLALVLVPLMLRRGWGPDAPMIQAALVSLVTLALFLDILSNRKQVWLVIGIAAGLAFLARRAGQQAADGAQVADDAAEPGAPANPSQGNPGGAPRAPIRRP